MQGYGGSADQALAQGDFGEFVRVQSFQPFFQGRGFLLGQGVLLFLFQGGEFHVGAVDHRDGLAVHAGQGVQHEFVPVVREEGHFIAAGLEGFQVRAVFQMGAGRAGKRVNGRLPFLHAGKVFLK